MRIQDRRCLHRPTLMRLGMSLNLDIDSLPPEKVEAAITRLEAMKAQRAAENKLAHYRPYPKQVAFHAAGVRCRERLLIAANQSGKSLAGAMEWPCTQLGAIPTGGKVGVSTSRRLAGVPAPPTRRPAIRCSESLSAGR